MNKRTEAIEVRKHKPLIAEKSSAESVSLNDLRELEKMEQDSLQVPNRISGNENYSLMGKKRKDVLEKLHLKPCK